MLAFSLFFGQLRDEFKDVLAREMGLFGGAEGFEAWMKINVHPTATSQVCSFMPLFIESINMFIILLCLIMDV